MEIKSKIVAVVLTDEDKAILTALDKFCYKQITCRECIFNTSEASCAYIDTKNHIKDMEREANND